MASGFESRQAQSDILWSMTTYYITQWALTQGILIVENPSIRDGYLFYAHIMVTPGEWFTDLDKAQERVKSKAEARVRFLEKSKRKMEALMLHGAAVKSPELRDYVPQPDEYSRGILNKK